MPAAAAAPAAVTESPLALIRFDGQVVLVTGAGRGLGRAYARLLAERGAHVVVHDAGVELDGTGSDPSVADGVVAEIRAAGGSASPAYQDLGSRAACLELVSSIERVDAVVHNAGLVHFESLERTALEDWERLRAVNVEAPLWISQAALPSMKERRYGRFVLTVSGHGLYRTGATDLAAYAVCKAAGLGLMNVLADEGAAHGVLANGVSPVAATRMYRRQAEPGELTPEQVAPAAVYLASSACSVSGLVLRAAGGRFSVGAYAGGEAVALATPEELEVAWEKLMGPLQLLAPVGVQ